MSKDERTITDSTADLANRLQELSDTAASLAIEASDVLVQGGAQAPSFFISGLTVFVLASFIGYHVVWKVTPALHSPLMAITNAISSVIIVGAIMAVGIEGAGFTKFLGFLAVTLTSINIFGGFVITKRMLHMFKRGN